MLLDNIKLFYMNLLKTSRSFRSFSLQSALYNVWEVTLNFANIWNLFFFLSYKIKYFKNNITDTTLLKQNLSGKSLIIGKKCNVSYGFR